MAKAPKAMKPPSASGSVSEYSMFQAGASTSTIVGKTSMTRWSSRCPRLRKETSQVLARTGCSVSLMERSLPRKIDFHESSFGRGGRRRPGAAPRRRRRGQAPARRQADGAMGARAARASGGRNPHQLQPEPRRLRALRLPPGARRDRRLRRAARRSAREPPGSGASAGGHGALLFPLPSVRSGFTAETTLEGERPGSRQDRRPAAPRVLARAQKRARRSEEHTSELQSPYVT